jgi:16S rRNA (cytosine967-C5)-methyltransferase
VAWQVLQAVASGAYADAALERELQRQQLVPADRALATELAYGTIRQRRLLDGWLDALGKLPAQRQPPRLRWLLHLGLYQLLFSDRVPASAAVSTTVELAKGGGLARLAPVANGLLRSALRRRQGGGSPLQAPEFPEESAAGQAPESGQAPEPWQGLELPADPAQALALRRSLPDWLAALLLQWLSPEAAEAFAVASNLPHSVDLRVNPLRASAEQLLEQLRAAGLEVEPLPGLPLGLSLRGRRGDLRLLPGFEAGQWCVQDRAAQRIANLLAPESGQRVLDACAAPGGKSTHLAELMGDRGELWAVDRSAARLERLRRNAARLGLGCIRSLAADALVLASEKPSWIGYFDRILLDAPCSGLGTLARHADARWRIEPEAIDALVKLQRSLLEALLPLLKPGGRLVYATCTVHPAENRQQVAALLADHPALALLESWQVWPGAADAGGGAGQAGDGFYAALLQG